MIWNQKEKRFSWPFIIFVIFSTLSLVVFDLVWRHVKMDFIDLTVTGVVIWITGVTLIYFKSR